MRWTLRVLSVLALLAIVVNAIVTEILPPGASITLSLPAHEALFYAPTTIEALVVAASVIALVVTAQRRQWGWFTGIFILLLISVYGGLVYFALSYVGLNRVLGNVPPVVIDGVMLGLAPLTALIYSFLPTGSKPLNV